VGTKRPPSCVSTRGGIRGAVEHPHRVEMREGGVGVGTKPPVSRFDARGGWEAVKTTLSCRNARGRCGVGRNAPVSRFDVRGALESGRNNPIASKHEREVWGG